MRWRQRSNASDTCLIDIIRKLHFSATRTHWAITMLHDKVGLRDERGSMPAVFKVLPSLCFHAAQYGAMMIDFFIFNPLTSAY